MRLLFCHCVVLITLTCSAVPALAQQGKVGVVAAVNPKAIGQAPHRRIQQLVIGHNVVRNERLATFNEGQVQLLLPDQSSLTLAENSEIVINDFVFDPRTGASRMTATISAGLVRYVGSKMSQKGNVQFLTPSGPVTLRGSSGALIRVKPNSPSSSG